MRKKIVALCFCACLAAGMTACSAETAADSASQAGTESTSAQAADTETTVQAPDSAQSEGQPQQTEPLLVYLNDFDAVIGDLFKEATGYEVEVVSGNGAETMSRIEAEKSNPQWDVVWIDSMYDIYNLSQDGSLLTDWESENAASLTEFSSALVPENKCFYPTGTHAAGVLVYRNDVYDETIWPIPDLRDRWEWLIRA